MNKYFALITGASRGFGKSMAFELARKGMNLVLIALPNSGLKELSSFIEKNYQAKTFYIEVDLSDPESYKSIADFVYAEQIEIKYLVNNAGILSRGLFDDLDEQYILKQIEVNVLAPTIITKLLMSNLKRNAPSGILNVSSMASFFALPKKQVYGGTKAYLLLFSKSLRKELKKDNISVSVVCPGSLNTTTRLCYQNRDIGWLAKISVLEPETAAKISIDGMLKKKELIIPGFINNCFMFLDKILPEWVKIKLTNREMEKLKPVA